MEQRHASPVSAGNTGIIMAENPSNFVRDWISENVRPDPAFQGDAEGHVAAIARRLVAASREAEIPQDDPELAPDLLHDLIQAAIEADEKPEAGGRR
ncbi:hypothetical protein [Methylobacterium flocculans]|uniref:hypothetical protein n=1 Tax=Methylobacterium flocculans TaxID=2984843 RepID=UPI0021F2756E|nr:hypothetical protein [Methylobacterium sp. FF17]